MTGIGDGINSVICLCISGRPETGFDRDSYGMHLGQINK